MEASVKTEPSGFRVIDFDFLRVGNSDPEVNSHICNRNKCFMKIIYIMITSQIFFINILHVKDILWNVVSCFSCDLQVLHRLTSNIWFYYILIRILIELRFIKYTQHYCYLYICIKHVI